MSYEQVLASVAELWRASQAAQDEASRRRGELIAGLRAAQEFGYTHLQIARSLGVSRQRIGALINDPE